MELSLDPDRCAQLHNELLARTLDSIPGAVEQVERNFISRVREEIPEEAAWLLELDEEYVGRFTPEDLAFYRFFSQINSYKPKQVPLSGEFMQPQPAWFYSESPWVEDDERHIILLYPDNVMSSPVDGGLFLDLDTWWVTWERLDVHGGIPKDEEAWVPLEFALLKSLDMWERGKYQWHGAPEHPVSISMRPWTARDLDEAVKSWEALLEEIQEHMPPHAPRQALQGPLPAELVDQFQISTFAKAFLAAAKRPYFPLVAPGLTVFTEDSFRGLMNSEPVDAPRRRFIARARLEPHEHPSLILPLMSTTPIPIEPPPPGDPFFDRDWGVGKFTVSRRAGLYTDPSLNDGDTSLLITAEGASQPMDFVVQRPWGTQRSATFSEMFQVWADLVREGTWEVGADGVITPHGWFTDPATKGEREMHWAEDYR